MISKTNQISNGVKPLIVANWKCNPATMAEAKELFDKIVEGVAALEKGEPLHDGTGREVVICPPFVYLATLGASAFAKSFGGLRIGSQDCFWQEKGAYTGEVSPKMLKDLGCQYVILGHSERRRNFGETDEMINKKIKAALSARLTPILCLSSAERGATAKEEMAIQLRGAMVGIEKSDIQNIVFTYEPVWAISTTEACVVATPENTAEGKIFIREVISELFGKDTAESARIIYGGSVDSKNISGFIKDAKMDGALVGAASLKPEEFVNAVKNATA
ncbi:MAG: triose-phosphate isomerase [Patescibacteria group bacterium]